MRIEFVVKSNGHNQSFGRYYRQIAHYIHQQYLATISWEKCARKNKNKLYLSAYRFGNIGAFKILSKNTFNISDQELNTIL